MLPVAAAGCRLPLLLSAATVGCRRSALKECFKGMERAESSENQPTAAEVPLRDTKTAEKRQTKSRLKYPRRHKMKFCIDDWPRQEEIPLRY